MTSMESINNFINNWSKKIVNTANNKKDVPKKINPKNYTLEALKKKYPNKECRQMGNIILIKNQNGSDFMQVEKESDGAIRISDKYDSNGEPTRTMKYKPDGTLDYFFADGNWNGEVDDGEDISKTQLNNILVIIYLVIEHLY